MPEMRIKWRWRDYTVDDWDRVIGLFCLLAVCVNIHNFHFHLGYILAFAMGINFSVFVATMVRALEARRDRRPMKFYVIERDRRAADFINN